MRAGACDAQHIRCRAAVRLRFTATHAVLVCYRLAADAIRVVAGNALLLFQPVCFVRVVSHLFGLSEPGPHAALGIFGSLSVKVVVT